MSVLVVDDVAFQCQLIQKTLTQYGHTVHMASNFEETRAALWDHPDITAVVCDLMMPSLDGIALLERCRQMIGRDLPLFILLTASDDQEYLSRARRAGFREIMSKPVEPAYLSRRLSELLAQQSKQTADSEKV